jgi:hypothetical protein
VYAAHIPLTILHRQLKWSGMERSGGSTSFTQVNAELQILQDQGHCRSSCPARTPQWSMLRASLPVQQLACTAACLYSSLPVQQLACTGSSLPVQQLACCSSAASSATCAGCHELSCQTSRQATVPYVTVTLTFSHSKACYDVWKANRDSLWIAQDDNAVRDVVLACGR